MLVVLQLVMLVAAVPLNVTVLEYWEPRKLVPVMVTASLRWAVVGVTEVNVGGGMTAKV